MPAASPSNPRFEAAHAVLHEHHAAGRLAGVSTLVYSAGEVVDRFCLGQADREAGTPLRPDHIHRAFSNTKLVTAVMTLLLVQDGRLALDAPVREWVPGFATTRVLRPGARTLDDTEPPERDITLRHLLSHTSGLSHGVFDPGTLLFDAYHARGLRRPDCSTVQIAERLPALPLRFQPGAGWEYAMGPDVLARVAEVVTGLPYAELLQRRLFGPLGMVDTGYVVPPGQRSRLAALYVGDVTDPLVPGLTRLDTVPWPDAHLKPVPRQSGASGLVTTQADMLALLQALLPGRGGPLGEAWLAEMARDQLPPELCVGFPQLGTVPALGFSLAGAVSRRPFEWQPNTPLGEMQWGGLAGTHWALSPSTGQVLVLMTQRHMGFWNPFWFAWKAAVYSALQGA